MRDYQSMVDLARGLEATHGSMIESVANSLRIGWIWDASVPNRRRFDVRGLSDEDARAVGAIEGAWQAFAEAVVRYLGGSGAPQSILSMDEQAREVAQAAFREAYAKAIGAVKVEAS